MQVGQNGADALTRSIQCKASSTGRRSGRMRPISQGIEQPYLHPIQSRYDGRAGKAAEVA